MPFEKILQPDIINIDDTIRLRKYDGNYSIGLPWYQNEIVYYNSEGITDMHKIPDTEYVKGMYDYFTNRVQCELYFIEVKQNNVYIPIGDVALKEENPPIAIGIDEYRRCGIGYKVMTAIINRAREIGIKRFYNTVIYDYNTVSQRLYESLGFKRVDIRGNEYIYEMDLV